MPPRANTPSSARPRGGEPERDYELPRRFCSPVHYVVEINSVTELLRLRTYESGVFEVGGYKWSLCLCPEGPRDREGKVYMSMYLSIEEPNRLGDSGNVVVDYKFFVFDNIRQEYVTFKERGTELRAFSRATPRWGLSKFLSLESFNKPEHGFRWGDRCKFGAEVLVSKPQRKKETLTIIREPRPNKATMKIRQFSALNSNSQYSDAFLLAGRNWKLKVYPQRVGGVQGVKWLSVYLEARGISPGKKIYVKANLRVLNTNPRNNTERTVSGWLSEQNCKCGCPEFMQWAHLEQPSGGFVHRNELVFKVEILVISNVERGGERV